jgi:hypothetical protein
MEGLAIGKQLRWLGHRRHHEPYTAGYSFPEAGLSNSTPDKRVTRGRRVDS